MKKMTKNLWILGMMFVALFGFASCEFDEDDSIGYDVKGHWFGDLDMWIDGEKARGSEIEFTPTGWGYSNGHGVEVDYYRYGKMVHYFDYNIRNGVIHMTFDDPDLDCVIRDYSLGYDFFRGYIDSYSGGNGTYFNLRNYDRYWNDYGYGDYYYSREETMNDTWADSTNDTIVTRAATGEKPHCIRGVNMKK